MPDAHAPQILAWPAPGAPELAQWQALWSELAAAPDLAPPWCDALIAGHGIDPSSLQLLTLGSGQRLDLVFPFQRHDERIAPGLRVRGLRPVQNVFALHGGLLTRGTMQSGVDALLEALLERVPGWDCLTLGELVMDSPLLEAWQQAAGRRGFATQLTVGERPPFIAAPPDFAGFLSGRSARFRKKQRAHLRELSGDPSFTLQVYQRPDEVAAFMAAVLEIERHSWKHAAGMAISARPWEQAFYDRLLAHFAAQGMLMGAILNVDGQPAAHSIDLVRGGHVWGLKTTFDARHAARGVGTRLLVAMVQRYFDAGCSEYDFLGTDEPYKLEWTTTVRQHVQLRLWRRTIRGRLGRLKHHLQGVRRWMSRPRS
ncbi:MAG TPA: GNAT family N-acetyltransferase [Steroidobacteraceae bacterium]|nr:GNAT family N-acetyltransferase [Steroidobacteraceae bacterium]